MQEVSYLIANYSKSSQKFDVWPFYGMNLYEKLILKLQNARDKLKSGQTPTDEVFEATNQHKKFKLWHDFKNCTEKILNEQTFHGFQLLLPSERGRVTRGGAVFACEPETYLPIVNSRFEKYAHHINVLAFNLKYRFVHWQFRIQFSTHPNGKTVCQTWWRGNLVQYRLRMAEKTCIEAEYTSLLVHVDGLLRDNPDIKMAKEIWYKLLTTNEYFEDCCDINNFALKFLTRTFNECSVEVQVSAITSIETSCRR